MNPHLPQRISPAYMLRQLWLNWQLILRLMRRDVVGRYKGSVLGLAWSFVTPIIMLAVYTFVFTVVFQARWGIGQEAGRAEFALQLFAGLIVHGVLAELLNRGPTLVLGNVNYVKKVVFPLEILPMIPLGSAVFHGTVSLAVLVLAKLLITGTVSATLWLAPVVLLPLVILALGVGWLLASLGVYLRDIGQTMGLLTTVLLFLSPIFYPLSALPESFQAIILLNPLTFIIEQFRAVTINGVWPDWAGLSLYTLVSFLITWVCFAWFQKTRKGFADVL